LRIKPGEAVFRIENKLALRGRVVLHDRLALSAAMFRNLTEKRNLINGIDRTGTGSNKGSALPSCSAAGQTGCAALSDIIGTPTLPRTVAIQATIRYRLVAASHGVPSSGHVVGGRNDR
jgi:hypothetical protein